ncbi:MAG: imidazole glycerol phosphate synthase subunit HisH [Candidatus Lokiarchaeota archaeon]|nr:imidazole glycerol phosphate synthase subunit HisH [Candidatus Lokiarchaeota archaeon]MBD3341398.1 imidazole glycerol phosphate synthase subunit HisH [Candidatus Lokiarchaeota archaeon]
MGFYIAIIDYEMGNLKSIYKCLKHIDIQAVITDKSDEILDADGVILPGVGAFGDAMRHLNQKNLIPIIHELASQGKPFFGICLGQQLLFSKSYEMGEHQGLDLIRGNVVRFDLNKVEKVPQIGWNRVQFLNPEHFLIKGIPNESYYYFVHSFYCKPSNEKNMLGQTQYGKITYCSIVSKKNIVASQFHPEKSGKYGIKIYQNFIEYCKR